MGYARKVASFEGVRRVIVKEIRRAFVLTLTVGADTRRALAGALYNLAYRVEAEEITEGVSGGYDSGYTYKLDVDESITHDSYFEELNAYLDAKRKEMDREQNGGLVDGAV